MQISEIQLSREKNESEIRILKRKQIRSDQSTAGHYEERQRQIQQDIESRRREAADWESQKEKLGEKIISWSVKSRTENELDTVSG